MWMLSTNILLKLPICGIYYLDYCSQLQNFISQMFPGINHSRNGWDLKKIEILV